jgi:hypothetical protein
MRSHLTPVTAVPVAAPVDAAFPPLSCEERSWIGLFISIEKKKVAGLSFVVVVGRPN